MFFYTWAKVKNLMTEFFLSQGGSHGALSAKKW